MKTDDNTQTSRRQFLKTVGGVTVASALTELTTPMPAYASLTNNIDNIRSKHRLPGLAVLATKDGQIAASAFTGVRKIDESVPIQPTDKFHLGSCSKSMTATTIAILIEEGKLRWDSTLFEIFPDDRMDRGYRKVTVEMIGAHRAGLTQIAPPELRSGPLAMLTMSPYEGREALLRHILTRPPEVIPGSKYQYSNLGYILLASIVDHVTKTLWETFVTDRLFKPLGMRSCGFGPPHTTDTPADQPWGHRTEKGVIVAAGPPGNDNPPSYNSAGRVHCTLQDWAKYGQLHIDGENGVKDLILKPESFKKLHESYAADPGQAYSSGGWSIMSPPWAGGPLLNHTGSNTLNHAEIWVAPKKNIVVVGAANIETMDAAPAIALREAFALLLDRVNPAPNFDKLPPETEVLQRALTDKGAWQLDGPPSTESRLTIEANALRADILRVDGTDWHISLHTQDLKLTEGEHYTLRFRGRVDRPRDMRIMAHVDGGNYQPIGLKEQVRLGTTWKAYEITFQATRLADRHSLMFFVGGSVGTVWIDQTSLKTGIGAQ